MQCTLKASHSVMKGRLVVYLCEVMFCRYLPLAPVLAGYVGQQTHNVFTVIYGL